MSSIRKKNDESYEVRFRHGGKQRALTFSSEKSARKWQITLDHYGYDFAISALNSELPPSPTVSEYGFIHINQLTGVTDGTRRSYRRAIEMHAGSLGDIEINRVSRVQIAEWINGLEAKGLSGKTIANIHSLLSATFSTAVLNGIRNDNPCKGLRLPRKDSKTEPTFLTAQEFSDLYYCIEEHYRPFVMTLVATGMRFGEATALSVSDINLETRTIRIRQAWKSTGKSVKELGTPKTKRSNRTIAIPQPLLQTLAELIDGQRADAFVFRTPTGGVIISGAFWRGVWAKAVWEFAGDRVEMRPTADGRTERKVIELGPGKHPRIHDLRHTFASWAIQSGVPLPVIQRTLGHESITTTIDRYGHLARADFDALATVTATFLPSHVRAIESGEE